MSESLVRLETSADEYSNGPAIPIRWLDDKAQSTIYLTQHGPLGRLGAHTEAAQDLLAVAVAVYCADRFIVRTDQADGWTRHIQLDVPVRRPDRWDNDLLQEAISFLTGDHWRIKLRVGRPHPGLRTTDAALASSDSAALFSGGVDSLAWAFETRHSDESMTLVSYFNEGPTAHRQDQLIAELGADRPHCRFRIQRIKTDRSDSSPDYSDRTTRSRSLLFLALGLLVARAHGAERLQMAENGYIAVNVPLHDGRIGSLSTRSAHPQFVDSLNRLIADADLGAKVENPYLLMTKGDVAERLVEHSPEAAWATISCAHPAAGRWRRLSFGNCGYCYPCIIRQAGFHRIGGDRTVYSVDPFTDISLYDKSAQSSDARAVARFLLDPVRVGDIMATGCVGTFEMAHQLHRMHKRGVEELRSLFEERSTLAIKERLGL